MKRQYISTIVAALAVAALAVSGCSTPNANAQAGNALPVSTVEPSASTTTRTAAQQDDAGRTVVSTGEGTATATPDQLTATLGVETTASTAQKALQDNNTAAARVIAVLKARGVAAADLQTAGVQITALTDDRTPGKITGYQVSNSLTVTLRSLPSAGATLDAVARTAGNAVRIGELQFGISDDSATMAEARAAAVKQAQAQAAQMAAAAGVTLGSIRTISDTQQSAPVEPRYASGSGSDRSVPLEAGSLTMSVQVEVVYSLAG